MHGYIPKAITESVIVPVVKDKNRCVNEKGNYSPICLSNICSKITDAVLINILDTYLQTTPNQFVFKPKHGTDLRVFVFKELLCIKVVH